MRCETALNALFFLAVARAQDALAVGDHVKSRALIDEGRRLVETEFQDDHWGHLRELEKIDRELRSLPRWRTLLDKIATAHLRLQHRGRCGA
jgi:hypothetical protein